MSRQCTVESVDPLDPSTDFSNEEQQHPVFVDFRPKRKLEDFDDADVSLITGQPDENGVYAQDEVVANVGGLEYRGSRNNEHIDNDTFIVVRNKKTNECHLIETETMFTVHPTRSVNYDSEPTDEEQANEQEDDEKVGTMMEQREKLVQLFGGRKSRIRFEAYRRENEQKIDEKVAKQVTADAGAMVARQIEETERATDGDGTSRHLAPPHNIDAKTPEDAYPLEMLLSQDEFDELSRKATNAVNEIRGAAEPQNPGWHDLTFRLLLQNCHDVMDEDLRHRRVIACFYLNIIIQMIRFPSKISARRRNSLTAELDIAPDHLTCLLTRFMQKSVDSGDFVQTSTMKDKLIYTGAVLWLTIEGFQNCRGVSELAAALGVTPKEMAMFVLRVGGKISKRRGKASGDFSSYRARLEVPLVFPKISVKRRRKSKS